MSAGIWIAVASAVGALAGAWYARRAAGQAKRSAEAAGRQAVAAEQQVAIMRQQLEDERADRHQAAAPQFEVRSAVIVDTPYGQHVARIAIAQTGGAAVPEVRITARRNDNVHGLAEDEEDGDIGTITWHDSAPGTTGSLIAKLEYNYVEPVNIVLDFTSVEAGTGLHWTCPLTAVAHRPDPESRRGGRVRGYD